MTRWVIVRSNPKAQWNYEILSRELSGKFKWRAIILDPCTWQRPSEAKRTLLTNYKSGFVCDLSFARDLVPPALEKDFVISIKKKL